MKKLAVACSAGVTVFFDCHAGQGLNVIINRVLVNIIY